MPNNVLKAEVRLRDGETEEAEIGMSRSRLRHFQLIITVTRRHCTLHLSNTRPCEERRPLMPMRQNARGLRYARLK